MELRQFVGKRRLLEMKDEKLLSKAFVTLELKDEVKPHGCAGKVLAQHLMLNIHSIFGGMISQQAEAAASSK